MSRQVAIHVPDDATLSRIDAAADEIGETRSTFMLKASLMRADGSLRELSAAKRKALVIELGESVAKALGL